jgi:hypothetical protein
MKFGAAALLVFAQFFGELARGPAGMFISQPTVLVMQANGSIVGAPRCEFHPRHS